MANYLLISSTDLDKFSSKKIVRIIGIVVNLKMLKKTD